MLNTNGEPKQRSGLRAVLPYTTIAVILAGLYVAWTFYSRNQENRAAADAIEAKKAEERKRVVDQIYGSGEVNFTTFGVDTGVLKRGETTELCYGVVNAKNVKIEPAVGETKPSYRHCAEIRPTKTTTYTITADDGAGHSKSASLTVTVK